MGRLSAYAKNRILKLRFKKNKRIIHIVDILKKDDNIKVSRQAVSTFLKKYLETNSIYDKPRTGRKRKLTQEEIQLIGQVTRLNRDITARAIKEYLNLNVSTYTILRATKLFEWNKVNPNSNDSKKAAALERQMHGDIKIRRSSSVGKRGKRSKSLLDSSELNALGDETSNDVNDTDLDTSKIVSLKLAEHLENELQSTIKPGANPNSGNYNFFFTWKMSKGKAICVRFKGPNSGNDFFQFCCCFSICNTANLYGTRYLL